MILGIQALTVEPGVTNKLSWATVSSLASRMADIIQFKILDKKICGVRTNDKNKVHGSILVPGESFQFTT